jgi:hypothetical protein
LEAAVLGQTMRIKPDNQDKNEIASINEFSDSFVGQEPFGLLSHPGRSGALAAQNPLAAPTPNPCVFAGAGRRTKNEPSLIGDFKIKA